MGELAAKFKTIASGDLLLLNQFLKHLNYLLLIGQKIATVQS